MISATLHQQPYKKWAESQFADLELGDPRRDQRAKEIASAMAFAPQKSIPQLFPGTYDIKAAYEFFKRDEVTPDTLQAQHRDLVMQRLQMPGWHLLVEDTTEMSWSGKLPIPGLGPIGPGTPGMQGFHLHSTLASDWHRMVDGEWKGKPSLEILGLADQQYYVRKERPSGEKKDSKAAKLRERESRLWEDAGRRIGSAPEDEEIKWIRVCDAAGDIYELMKSCKELNHRYVIRGAQDRSLTDEAGKLNTGSLFKEARKREAIGEFNLQLRGREGKKGRVAHLKVSVTEAWIRSPQRPGAGPGAMEPVRCRVVRTWEEERCDGEEGLEWMLLTDLEVEGYETALEVVMIYASRWLIEEYHKALKSGTRAEALQMERAEALFAAIAIKSIVALRLLDLRERIRLKSEAPAEEAGLTEIELALLRKRLGRPIKTVREVGLAIGRLGGHMNRKGDGMPGWQTLFRGYERLRGWVEGVELARKMKIFG